MRSINLAGPIAAVLAVAVASAGMGQTNNNISVPVDGLRNDQGVVRCGLYASAKGFREPGKEFKGVTAPISGGKATCVFNEVPPGTYAVALFHAEHNEAQLETGMFGKPKQGYGFSRDAKGSFGPPTFEAAAYTYPGGPSVWPVHIEY
jgi:uncharacterized protein (DUF2141 family)